MNVKIIKNPFEKIKEGVNDIADFVKLTMGPNGKNNMFARGIMSAEPMSTRDGVSCAFPIEFKDPVKDIGARLLRQAAKATNEIAGDGTTQCTVLAQAIFNEGLKYIAAGHSPVKIKRSIDEASVEAVKRLKDISRPVTDVEHVATISANNDPFIGKIIAEAVNKVGKDGSVLVENSTKNETFVSFQDGMIIERGWNETHPYFITNLRKKTVEYENPDIIIMDYNIDNIRQIELPLRHVVKSQKPLIFIVSDIEESVLAMLVLNKVGKDGKGGLPIAVIKTPGFHNIDIIDDLACRSGARYYHPDRNPIGNFKSEDLGGAEKIIIRKSDTTIIQGRGDISGRLAELNEQIKHEENELSKAVTQERINRLTSSVATINLSANSETEMKDLKLRVEDAINAVRHALSEGVVQGGGTALLRIKSNGESIGDKILDRAFEEPFRCIINNADENAEKIMAEVEKVGGTYGYDAHSKTMTDMFNAGIIDPTTVTKTALEKAVSVSTMLLMTGSVLIKDEEEANG